MKKGLRIAEVPKKLIHHGFPTMVLTNRFKGSGFRPLNSHEYPQRIYYIT